MLNERKLTKPELAKREDIIIDMKKNKRKLVKRYGVDAEKVMYGRATNMAKKQTENMDDKKLNLRKMIEAALQNPKSKDLNESSSEHMVKYSKPNNTYQVWLGDEIVTDFSTKERADSEAKRLNALQDGKRVDQSQDISGEKDEMSLGNIGLAELEEMGYEAGEKATYTYATIVARLQNRPDKLAYNKGFIQGVKDELGSSLSEDLTEDLDLGHEAGVKSEAISRLADFFGVSPSSLQKFKFDGKDPIKDLTNALNATSYEGAEAYYKIAIEMAKRDLGIDESVLNEDLDLGHEDNEPHMLKADLYRIGKYAMDLYQMMDEFEGKGEVDLPHWWQSKISNAKSSIVGAKHYLDFEIKEPQLDAMVDKIDDISPEMEIDEGMSEKEWAEATEKANLSKLKNSDQDKIKKIVAMLKAEKKS